MLVPAGEACRFGDGATAKQPEVQTLRRPSITSRNSLLQAHVGPEPSGTIWGPERGRNGMLLTGPGTDVLTRLAASVR